MLIYVALALFAITYILMLVFSKYRPYVALASGLIFIVSGMLPLGNVLSAIDFNVILMIAPVALEICRKLKTNPVFYYRNRGILKSSGRDARRKLHAYRSICEYYGNRHTSQGGLHGQEFGLLQDRYSVHPRGYHPRIISTSG